MAEIPNSGFEAEESSDLEMDTPIKNGSAEFVAVDIGNLFVLAEDSNSSPRFIKSFSRKGSQAAVEKKAAEGEAAAAAAYATTGGAHAITVAGHVAVIEEAVVPFPVSTPTAAGGKIRRLGSANRRPPPWRDPRKVMVFFAAVSCIGTLILLYFTLSMGKN